jgi:hypothetical protein
MRSATNKPGVGRGNREESMKAELIDALTAVMEAPSAQVNWAYHYAEYALNEKLSDADLHTQLLYVIGNLDSWRGEVARSSKVVIRAEIKRLED